MRSTLLTSQHRFSDSIYRLPDRGYSRVGLDDYYQLCGAGASGSFHNASGYPVIDLSLFPDMKSAPHISSPQPLPSPCVCLVKGDLGVLPAQLSCQKGYGQCSVASVYSNPSPEMTDKARRLGLHPEW